MKKLFEFTVNQLETVKESKQEKRDDGSEVTVTQDVEKNVEHKFFLRRPTRSMFDEAELFYAVALSEGIKAGLLTRALLLKRFNNDGGILSTDQQEALNELYTEILEKQQEFQRLSLKTKSERSEAEQKKYKETLTFLHEARKQIQDFESAQAALYDQTAENRARNKSILWWILFLSYKEEGEKETPMFPGEDHNAKLAEYDKIEEVDDEFLMTVISKFSYYISFWYVSKANTPEEFKELLQLTEQTDQSVDQMLEEEAEEEARSAKEAAIEQEELEKEVEENQQEQAVKEAVKEVAEEGVKEEVEEAEEIKEEVEEVEEKVEEEPEKKEHKLKTSKKSASE